MPPAFSKDSSDEETLLKMFLDGTLAWDATASNVKAVFSHVWNDSTANQIRSGFNRVKARAKVISKLLAI